MGHIQKRGERKYQARWLDPDGRERAQTFTRKADAERRIAVAEGAKLAGSYIDQTSKVTVAEYAKQWAATRPHRQSTADRIAYLIDKHIEGTSIGARRLSAVRPSEVQAWVSDRAKVLSPGTVRLLVSVLRSIFSAAVQDRLIASSPAARLSLPRSERKRIVPLTVAQVQALAEAMPQRCKAMVITQAGLGLRIGELMALRVQDIDFLRRTVAIEFQTTPDGKQRVPPKTPRSRRTVPLPSVVAEALAAHISQFPAAADGSLFTGIHGKPWRHEYYGTRVFARAVRKAGLPDGTTSHDLRHHFASILLAAGESVVAVAERLGHENAALVLSTYGHLMPDSEDRTRRAIDQAWISDGPGTDGGDRLEESGLVSG
jgi:integrase